MSDWRPIETAPKDGTWILGWNPKWKNPHSMRFHRGMWRDYASGYWQPREWHPMPDLPDDNEDARPGDGNP